MQLPKLQQIAIDLHCHSIYSDGDYTVQQLLETVKNNKGNYIALTDHDTLDGINEAKSVAKSLSLKLIPGVEISVSWRVNQTIHIIGLGIRENDEQLIANLEKIQATRIIRAKQIASKLSQLGIQNAFEGAASYTHNLKAISRLHFAKFLVHSGKVANISKAFSKYLGNNCIANVPHQWATLQNAVNWIKQSGGIAVIAHPCRYKFSRMQLLELIREFKAYGGTAIEVIGSSYNSDEIHAIANIAKQENLLSSLGTDFHSDNHFKPVKVGLNYLLPKICNPIYSTWNIIPEIY